MNVHRLEMIEAFQGLAEAALEYANFCCQDACIHSQQKNPTDCPNNDPRITGAIEHLSALKDGRFMGFDARNNPTARDAGAGKLMSRQTMMGAMDHALEMHAAALRLFEARIVALKERVDRLEEQRDGSNAFAASLLRENKALADSLSCAKRNEL